MTTDDKLAAAVAALELWADSWLMSDYDEAGVRTDLTDAQIVVHGGDVMMAVKATRAALALCAASLRALAGETP